MIAWDDILLRLGVATLASAAIGLNRDLHGKPIGVRTLGLVGLACATVVIFAMPTFGEARLSDATSRVIQGILTGIGFLGAGVIVHAEVAGQHKVHGLTSAACVWFTACIGIVCGAGQWQLVLVAGVLAALLLSLGGPIERFFHRLRGGRSQDLDQSSDAGPHQPGK